MVTLQFPEFIICEKHFILSGIKQIEIFLTTLIKMSTSVQFWIVEYILSLETFQFCQFDKLSDRDWRPVNSRIKEMEYTQIYFKMGEKIST